MAYEVLGLKKNSVFLASTLPTELQHPQPSDFNDSKRYWCLENYLPGPGLHSTVKSCADQTLQSEHSMSAVTSDTIHCLCWRQWLQNQGHLPLHASSL